MDIVFVTYNSEKWIDNCFESLAKTDLDLKTLSIFVVDNASTDNTLNKLDAIKEKLGNIFSTFDIVKSDKNLGFGRANNIGFKRGNAETVCFLNIDTEVYPETLQNLERDIKNSKEDVGVWELRQFPYEHPKVYDALTHETSWCSGAAFAARRDVFEQVGGFDEAIFMYAEDVDLSWRIRSFGYKLKYVPSAVINHYSYVEAGQVKPTQHVNSVINNLLLRYRFGGMGTVLEGHKLFWKVMALPCAFPHSKRLLFKAYIKHFGLIPHFRNKKYNGRDEKFTPNFIGFDYEGLRDGAFYVNELPKEKPLVSIIVRTCGRPCVLRETLMSLRDQTYDNIEIVVVEDGEEISKQMIERDFSDLRIVYQATGNKVGRSKAGNIAMSLATGKYLNFLDDDDLFYADHVEVLVNALNKSKNRAAYAFAFETPIEVMNKDPYEYRVYRYNGIHKQVFDKLMLCHHNYIPIQCIMFEKTLFEQYGGLDETLDALEDWDLWVRYSLYTDFDCVPKTTSIYRVPYLQMVNEKRQKELDDALITVREKHKGYKQSMSVYEFAKMYEEGC